MAQHTYADVVLTGTMNPRRRSSRTRSATSATARWARTTGSNTLANAFHGGARNTVEACVVCHDQNRFSSTVMTNGLALSENYRSSA